MSFALSLDTSREAELIRFCCRFINGTIPSASNGPVRLRLGSSDVLSQVHTIISYFARTAGRESELFGSNPTEIALINQWLSISSNYQQDDSQSYLEKFLDQLDQHLLNVSYVACNRLTIADVIIWWTIYLWLSKLEDKKRVKHRNVLRWFDQLQNTNGIRGYRSVDLIPLKLQKPFVY